ncbi:MAG: hypothetical protein KFH98_15630 [Gemmatimonadetes bacterium]|nr:hypothetical protein [Gemmatimonadota bacterium]
MKGPSRISVDSGRHSAYLGTDLTGPEAVAELHFPGLDPEAAEWLVTNRSIVGQLPPVGSYVVALPMKIEGGSGGPLRIVAYVP